MTFVRFSKMPNNLMKKNPYIINVFYFKQGAINT